MTDECRDQVSPSDHLGAGHDPGPRIDVEATVERGVELLAGLGLLAHALPMIQ
jgi:hypothetical protein